MPPKSEFSIRKGPKDGAGVRPALPWRREGWGGGRFMVATRVLVLVIIVDGVFGVAVCILSIVSSCMPQRRRRFMFHAMLCLDNAR